MEFCTNRETLPLFDHQMVQDPDETLEYLSAIAKGAAIANDFEVEEGAVIKACYVEFWVKADNPNFTVSAALLKRPFCT